MRTALAGLVLLVSAAPCRAAELWHYGAYLDGAYEADLNHPDNHLFRDRGTTRFVGQPVLNMALLDARKDAAESSRWGLELGVQAGKDSEVFGYSGTSPNLDGSQALRRFSRANLSYLAPVGRGLTVQAGLFNSVIGEESLYAKDNFNYTRTWIADYSPYMMFGGNVSYPFSDETTAGVAVINEYFHLSRSNAEPAYVAYASHKATAELTLKQSVLYGPDQGATAPRWWRLFSDSILEWKRGPVSAWLAYDAGTERLAEQSGYRAFWMGGALAAKWDFAKNFSVAERPEFYWDHDGRLTGHRQRVAAVTTTLECRLPSWKGMGTTLRLEHRHDESTGAQGGFFRGHDDGSGQPPLTRGHDLLLAALLWTFGGP